MPVPELARESVRPLPLRTAMVAMGIRGLDLARVVGISPGYLSMVANGHRVAPADLRARISAALETPEVELFG